MAYLSELQESTLIDSSTTSTCMDVHSRDTFSRDIASYIEPRDPSITNHWMRPRPTHGTNLCLQFEHSEIASEENQHLEVFLRIKPISETQKQDVSLYEIQNKSLITKSRCIKKIFNFSHIFSQTDTQVQVFNAMIKDNLFKFVEMQDFTLLTYGSSGSGKTYSLMGTAAQPGIIPRCLEFLFAKVQPDKQPRYKPIDGNILEELAPRMKEKEIQAILSMVKNCGTASCGLAPVDNIADYRRMSHCLIQENQDWRKPKHNINRYEVWVSFAEIYNEAVHDLLRVEVPGRMQEPAKLKIIQSATQQPYIKGVRWVCVRSGIEAYAALAYGKRRLRYAHTNINSHSSRSHCLFTLKLIKYKSDGSGAQVSTLRLCDLAGLERAKKTLNEGARLAESRNINTSLHILERCLAAKRSKQVGLRTIIPPYRESKLTQLLQNALSGREAIAMLVNINPESSSFDETQRVLEFSALAAEILVTVDDKIDPMLIEFKLHKEIEQAKIPDFSSVSEQLELSDDQTLYKENAYLREQIERMHEENQQQLIIREREVRKEISEKFFIIKERSDMHNQENIDNIKDMMQTQHQWEMDSVTEFYKKRVSQLEGELEELALYKAELKKAHRRIEYLERELESERAKNEANVKKLLINSHKMKEDLVKLTVENHHLELESEDLAASFLLAEAKYASSQRHLKKAEQTILNITGISETADSDDEGTHNEAIGIENTVPRVEDERIQIEYVQECSENDQTPNTILDDESTLNEATQTGIVDNTKTLDKEIELIQESADKNESAYCEASTINDEGFQEEEIEKEFVMNNECPENGDTNIASDQYNDCDKCVNNSARNDKTVNLSLNKNDSLNNDIDSSQLESNSIKKTHDESSEVFLSDFGRLSVSNHHKNGSISPSNQEKLENDKTILSGIDKIVMSEEDLPDSTIDVPEPLVSNNIPESVDDTSKLDNTSAHLNWVVKCEIVPEIVNLMDKENVTDNVKITPEKKLSDIAEERLVSGFYTVNKENTNNFNIQSGAKSSRRKLFARRPLDEVAAETRITRSNRCLNFSTESPECIIPPPISKPYILEKSKSTRKKKLV